MVHLHNVKDAAKQNARDDAMTYIETEWQEPTIAD
jgi:hypothetical protein